MLRTLLLTSAFTAAFVCLTGFSGCPGGEGEGEGEGEGAGEGEGEGGEGEGAGEGEGEGAGEGEGEGEGATRTFTCQDPNAPVVSQASCTDDSECAPASIATDCCGTLAVTGINAFSMCQFQGAAAGCFQAVCDCAAQPTLADDGTRSTTLDQTPTLACVNHVCTTSFALPPTP